MAKKKSATGVSVGDSVKVRDDVTSPEFPEVSLAGWSGTAVEISGRGADKKVIIEWDESTQQAMPADYVAQCEAQQLFVAMACLKLNQVEPATN